MVGDASDVTRMHAIFESEILQRCVNEAFLAARKFETNTPEEVVFAVQCEDRWRKTLEMVYRVTVADANQRDPETLQGVGEK